MGKLYVCPNKECADTTCYHRGLHTVSKECFLPPQDERCPRKCRIASKLEVIIWELRKGVNK